MNKADSSIIVQNLLSMVGEVRVRKGYIDGTGKRGGKFSHLYTV